MWTLTLPFIIPFQRKSHINPERDEFGTTSIHKGCSLSNWITECVMRPITSRIMPISVPVGLFKCGGLTFGLCWRFLSPILITLSFMWMLHPTQVILPRCSPIQVLQVLCGISKEKEVIDLVCNFLMVISQLNVINDDWKVRKSLKITGWQSFITNGWW